MDALPLKRKSKGKISKNFKRMLQAKCMTTGTDTRMNLLTVNVMMMSENTGDLFGADKYELQLTI